MKKRLNKLFEYYNKYEEIISYLIFGALTVLVNYIVYVLCTRVFNLNVITSTIISWFIAVLFAYVTNRKFVFKSKVHSKKEILKESITFIVFRVISGVMDVIVMYITVNVMEFNDMVMKLISNIIVIVANYLFSKLFIFNNK